MKPITRIFDLLDRYQDAYPDKPDAFLSKTGDAWDTWSASDYIRTSRLLSLGFLSLGIKPGTRIATVIANCPEWNFFDMAIMQVGAVHVPIYPTISEDDYHYILSDSQAEYLIVHNRSIYWRIRSLLEKLPSVKDVYTITKIPGVKSWKEILQTGEQFPHPQVLDEMKAGIAPSDMVSVIYTSGTTGLPKGVMLSHRNFVSNFMACAHIPRFTSRHRALSFLPLCHVYERMLNYLYQYHGVSVYYAQLLEQVPEFLKEIQPHAFAAVPRVLEKMYNKIVAHGRDLKGWNRRLFFWALRQGHKFELDHARGVIYDIKLFIANRLVFHRWRKALGGQIQIIVSGGAALHPRLARVFWAAGLNVIEGYGLTETSPVIAVQNLESGGVRFGTVGSIIRDTEVKIADDGEILCKGPGLMMGYYNRPERTAEVIDQDGWFHTGDVGLVIDDRYLRITDRKKEIFKTSTGRYIAPQPIEQRFTESPFIDHVMILGEFRKYVAALIVPNFEHLRNWCRIKQVRFGSNQEVVLHPRIIKRIGEEIHRINLDLGQTEKIKKFRLLPVEWSVESGELSPTMKLRRKFIQEKYYDEIEKTYKSPDFTCSTDGI